MSPHDLYEGISQDLSEYFDMSSGAPIRVRATNHTKPLEELDKAATDLIASKGKLFTSTINKYGQLKFDKKNGDKYFTLMNKVRNIYKPTCRYSEAIMLLFETADRLGLWDEDFISPDTPSRCPTKKQGELFNDFVEVMQKEGNTKEFKKKVYARKAKALDNLKSAAAYEQSMFVWRSRLMVVRVDLGYLAEYGDAISIADARKDFKHFLNNRRSNPKIFGDLGGYIWKLEYGSEGKGFHYHVIFFFDGGEVENSGYKANQIGEYWKTKITTDRGYFHNCNLDRHKYKHWGIGMIYCDDVEKRKNLAMAIKYLTKKDYCFKLDMDGGRVFQTGGKPPENTTRVGRPRTPKNPDRNYRGRLLPSNGKFGAYINC